MTQGRGDNANPDPKKPAAMYGSRNNQQATPQQCGGASETTRETPDIYRGDDIVHRNQKEWWLKQVVVGSVLGDGCLTPLSKRRGESQLYVGCDDKHHDYLVWLHAELQELGVHPIKPKRGFHQHYFYSIPLRQLGELRNIFYPQGEKIVPESIGRLLVSPIALAVWYQDDGTLDARKKDHWNSRIATYCFTKDDCIRLAETLRENFDLEVGVARCTMRKKVYWQLYVRRCSMNHFVDLVRPYVQPCFLYKIRQG